MPIPSPGITAMRAMWFLSVGAGTHADTAAHSVRRACERVVTGRRTGEGDHPLRACSDERRAAQLCVLLEERTRLRTQARRIERERVQPVVAGREAHDVAR